MSQTGKQALKVAARQRKDAGRTGSHGQQTLASILTTAADIASKDGLEQLTMGHLALAVGMSKSGLYAHFDSKEHLQLATIEHVLEVFDAKVVRDRSAGGHAGLSALLERWLKFFERKVFPGGCFIITSAVEFAHSRGPVREALGAALAAEVALLEGAICEAIDSGELHPRDDVEQAAFELHSILMEAHALFQVADDAAVFPTARAAFERVLRPVAES